MAEPEQDDRRRRRLIPIFWFSGRALLRQVSPIVAVVAAVAITALTLPSLPTSNPFAAQVGSGGTATNPLLTPSAGGTETTAPGASVVPGGGPATGPGAVALRPGTRGVPQSTTNFNPYIGSGTKCDTYQGVFCDHIDTVIHYTQGAQCPQDQDLGPFLFGLGVVLDPVTSVNLLAPYFNEHAQELYPPQYANAFKAGGFWGRKIQPIFDKNDGGAFCPDQNTSAAVRYATVNHAFTAIGGAEASSEGSGDIIAPQLAAYRVMSIEPTWNRDPYYTSIAPYAWSSVPSGETIMRHWVNMICSYLKYHNSFNMTDSNGVPDATSANKPRVFSIVYNDRDPENKLAAEFKPRIQACGATYGTDVGYKSDLATAPEQARDAQARLKAAGTTTVVYLGSAVAALVGSQYDSNTHWYHEWLLSEYGFLDSPTAVDNLPADEWKWAYGVAESNGYTHAATAFCQTPWGKIWCDAYKRAPCSNANNCAPGTYPQYPPSDYELWFVNLLEYGAQLIAAGPNLSPQTIQQGMFQSCAPCPAEVGVSYPTLSGFGPRFPDGPYNSAKDYEFVRWDPNIVSPYELGVKDPNHYTKGSYAPATNYPDLFPGLPDPGLGWKRWFDWNTPDPRF